MYRLSLGMFILAQALFTIHSQAVTITISDTQTSPQLLTNGDTLNITSTGNLAVNNNNAVSAGLTPPPGGPFTITNNGIISVTNTAPVDFYGIHLPAGLSNITNNGQISVSSVIPSAEARGVNIGSNVPPIQNNTLTNTGTISVSSAGNATGVYMDLATTLPAAYASFNNSGTISVSGSSAASGLTLNGVLISGNVSTFSNSGIVTVTETGSSDAIVTGFDLSNAIASLSMNFSGTTTVTTNGAGTATGATISLTNATNRVINHSGNMVVSSAEGAAIGFFLRNSSGASFTNTGTINISGTSAIAIIDGEGGNNIINYGTMSVNSPANSLIYGKIGNSGGGSTFTNYGALINNNGNSVDFTGDGSNPTSNNDIFNYYTSGYTVGSIVFGSGNNNQFNVYDSDNDTAHQIAFSGSSNVNLSPSLLYIMNDPSAISVISRTPFARKNEMGSEINRDVANIITDNLDESYIEGKKKYVWAKAFGDFQERPVGDSLLKSKTQSSGVLVGADKATNDQTRLGFFVGGLYGKTTVHQIQNKDRANGGIVGIYSDYRFNNKLFLNAILSGGYMDHDLTRQVFNNSGPASGSEFLNASQGEWFIAPSVKFGSIISLKNNFIFTPSISATYLCQDMRKYTEKGSSTAALMVSSQKINTLLTRGELKLSKDAKAALFNVRGGIESSYRDNKSFNVYNNNTGASGNLKAGGMRNYLDAFLGLGFNSALVNYKNIEFSGVIEASKGINHSSSKNYGVNGNLGVTIRF